MKTYIEYDPEKLTLEPNCRDCEYSSKDKSEFCYLFKEKPNVCTRGHKVMTQLDLLIVTALVAKRARPTIMNLLKLLKCQ